MKPLPLLIKFFTVTTIILSSCNSRSPDTPSSSSTDSSKIVIQRVLENQEEIQEFELDNCGGKSEIARTEYRGSSVNVTVSTEVAARTGASIEVISAELEASLGAALGTVYEKGTSVELKAPPNTHMFFQLAWTGKSRNGEVQNVRGSGIPVPFYSFSPDNFRIKNQYDLLCGTSMPVSTDESSVTKNSSQPAATEMPEPSISSTELTAPHPSEDALYQADWSNGFDGWVGSPDWKAVSGMIVNDSLGEFPNSGIIMPPYQPGEISDYAVEADIQVVGGRDGGCAAHYGFIVRGQEQQAEFEGYLIGAINAFCRGQGYMTIATWKSPAPAYNASSLKSQEPIDDGNWHKYRVEVRGNTIRLLIDGLPALEATDNRYLDGGFVALWSGKAMLNVKSFRILKL